MFVWVIEVVSVMLQVVWFRTTGKRILLMSPLHHHFELAGWGERTTVFAFLGLQLLGLRRRVPLAALWRSTRPDQYRGAGVVI